MPKLDDSTIQRLRDETPGCASRTHLNNAGAGLMPASVLEEVRAHLKLESELGGYEAAAERAPEIDACYGAVGELVGAQARNIGFVENATVAYSQALSAIPMAPGDVILTSRNDYISNQLMFLSMVKRLGIRIVRAPDAPSGGIDVEACLELLAEHRPKLLAVTHIPTSSGLVQPVEDLGAACQELGVLYLVDACQSVGQMPIDAPRLRCDFLSATSRKFLRGPRGAGFLYVSDRALEAGLEPLFIDMRGATWTGPDSYAPVASARRFENWEFAYALVLGTGAAARLATSLGLEAIRERSWGLAEQTRQLLSELPGVRVLDQGAVKGAIVTFHIEGRDPKALSQSLSQAGFNTTLSLQEYAQLDFADKGCDWAIRASPHYYNTQAEVQAFAQHLAELLGA